MGVCCGGSYRQGARGKGQELALELEFQVASWVGGEGAFVCLFVSVSISVYRHHTQHTGEVRWGVQKIAKFKLRTLKLKLALPLSGYYYQTPNSTKILGEI